MIRILTGDCRDVLPTLEAGSVHCVVCSPPYYALRSYLDAAHPDKHREIGSEATPDEYIQTMVEVFREVRRVLRDDGTCWVNMGDSYASQGGGGESRMREIYADDPSRWKGVHSAAGNGQRSCQMTGGLAAKQLLMMPARLALALQADGWWLRSQIVWAKPNPMPESVTDRPTSAYEMVYLLSKRSRYFYDADAVREEQSENTHSRGTKWLSGDMAKVAEAGSGTKNNRSFQAAMADLPPGSGRNLRNVWSIATAPYSEAHFATFPPELAERCIKAGTSERGCCAQCGKPWMRQTDTEFVKLADRRATRKAVQPGANMTDINSNNVMGYNSVTTTGWSPGCQCNAEVVPCVVLDPFSGAGTSGLVADRLGRDAVMIDLNHQYVEMARARLQADCPLFADITDAPVASEDAYDRDMRDLFAEVAD